MREPVTFPALGTTAALLVTDDRVIDTARAMLVADIDAIDLACSRFRDDSELGAVNANAGQPTAVSALFMTALETALRAARISGGLVDPTVGSALRLLGYDRDFDTIEHDGPPVTVSLQRVPGWQSVSVDQLRSTVCIPRGVELDFGATAKALCADRAARAIATTTGTGVLVSLGGDIAVGGAAPEAGWPLLITDAHAAGPGASGQRIAVRSGGVATSGTTVRRWRRGGEDLHHVIDPASGRPARGCWRTATVAAASCVDANIASTTALVMGADAPAWLAARRLPARLVARDGMLVYVASWPAAEPAPC